jgi:hypothetical protein
MAERLSNLGYMALKKEATKGTAVIPDDYVPLYDESMSTSLNLVEDNPVIGNKWARYQVLQGQRSHGGDFTVMAEPNTTAKLFDGLMAKGTTTGSAPYTHPFTFSSSTDPNSYTIDISTGNHVFRLIGAQISKLGLDKQDNELQWKGSLSALKSFYGREVASISTTSVTFKTDYDPSPTTGLVTGDLVRLVNATSGATADFTIASITNGVTVVLNATAAAFAAGDFFHLRPATPTYTLKTPFLFALTEFRLATTASAALSATHTAMEQDSTFEVQHMFEDDGGAKRSGSFDPASLPRTQADASVSLKKFWDTPLEVKAFNNITQNTALVVRMFSEAQVYECRLTFNNLKYKDGAKPMLKSGEILYQEFDMIPAYNATDGQAFDAKIINNLSTI